MHTASYSYCKPCGSVSKQRKPHGTRHKRKPRGGTLRTGASNLVSYAQWRQYSHSAAQWCANALRRSDATQKIDAEDTFSAFGGWSALIR